MVKEVYTCNICGNPIAEDDADAKAIYFTLSSALEFTALTYREAHSGHLDGKCFRGLYLAYQVLDTKKTPLRGE